MVKGVCVTTNTNRQHAYATAYHCCFGLSAAWSSISTFDLLALSLWIGTACRYGGQAPTNIYTGININICTCTSIITRMNMLASALQRSSLLYQKRPTGSLSPRFHHQRSRAVPPGLWYGTYIYSFLRVYIRTSPANYLGVSSHLPVTRSRHWYRNQK